MNKLQELIDKLCPDGVEFKKIKEVSDFVQGFAFKNNTFKKDGVGLVRTTNIQDKSISEENMVYINATDYKENLSKYVIEKDRIIIGMSGTIKVGMNNSDKKYYLNQRVGMFIPNEQINNKYLFYILDNAIPDLYNLVSGSSVKNLSSNVLNDFIIAVPPLPVQCEIVHILDDFTLLSAELSAELKARQKQYNYYRDNAIINVLNTKKYKLSEIAQIYDGTHQTPKYTDSGISFISVENISDIYHSKKYISKEDYDKYKIKPEINDVFMTRIGSIGKCSVFDKEMDLAYYVSLALIRPNQQIINSYYLKYLIESIIGIKELRKRTLVNAVPIKINKDDIGKIILPVPPLEEQLKIVKILDRFDKLCNDITSGIPAEIEARQKQYEYYRDKLLSFKELK